ncbi:MAG: T9SS type A sorting domain-containing protein [Ignavibacteria bacterium]|nr:T9SS type A sorting domain-containing protein [Ignavibacteria bacterium]
MLKYILTAFIFMGSSAFAQLTPLQRFQDIHAVRAIIVSNSRILAATGQNILLTSTDFGVTWDEISNPLLTGINKLTVTGNSLIFGCGENGKVIRSTDNGLSWHQLATGTSANLISITTLNSNTILACGTGGTVIRSTDNGETWNVTTHGISNLNDISFSNQMKGWVAGDNATLLGTTDGGNSWSTVQVSTSGFDMAVLALHSDTMVTVFGRNGMVLASTNGGLDWKNEVQAYYMQGDTVIAAWHKSRDSVLFADDGGSIVLCVIRPDTIFCKKYGGQTPPPRKYLAAFKSVDNWFYVAGVGPSIARAFNKSAAWEQLLLTTKGIELWKMRFADSNVGIVCGKIPDVSFWTKGFVFTTTDGGQRWKQSADVRPLLNVHAISPQRLTMIDFALWFSDDSGKTWQRQYSAGTYQSDVVFLDSNNAYLINYVEFPGPYDIKSRLYRSTNGGTSWTLIRQTSEYWYDEILVGSGGLVWLWDGSRSLLMVSKDHGYNINALHILYGGDLVGGLALQRGYMALSSGRISFTSDAGISWTTTYNSPGAILNGGSKSIDGKSIVVGNNGKIIATTNSGETWQQLNSGITEHLTSVALLPDFSYVVGTVKGEFYKGNPPEIFTGIEDENIELPVAFTLGNYPNPFNGSTVIHFTLPEDFNCRLEVFSSLGSLVFSNDIKGSRGENRFNYDAAGLESGVYFYRIKAGGKYLTGKMLLLK